MADLPGAVLFSCNYNRVRSPMAQALMRLTFGDRIYVESCGLKPSDDDVDPFVVAVMDELGADLSNFQPKTFGELIDGSFDLVISLTPEAHHRAVELTRAGPWTWNIGRLSTRPWSSDRARPCSTPTAQCAIPCMRASLSVSASHRRSADDRGIVTLKHGSPAPDRREPS